MQVSFSSSTLHFMVKKLGALRFQATLFIMDGLLYSSGWEFPNTSSRWVRACLYCARRFGELLSALKYCLNQGCATFFSGGPLLKVLTTSRASHRQICIKL